MKKSHLNQKQQFLRSKGLTEDEIQIACERSGVFTDPTSSGNYKNSSVVNMGGYPSNLVMQPKQTTFGKIKEVLNSIALISGLTYAVYLFYKVFTYCIIIISIIVSPLIQISFFSEIH